MLRTAFLACSNTSGIRGAALFHSVRSPRDPSMAEHRNLATFLRIWPLIERHNASQVTISDYIQGCFKKSGW